MNYELLGLIRKRVLAQFDQVDFNDFKHFADFWDQVDTYNTYEEDWEDSKDSLEVLYCAVWIGIMKDQGIQVERDLIDCSCNTCGTHFETYYDRNNDYYICKFCSDKEEDEELNEYEDEDEDEDEEGEEV